MKGVGSACAVFVTADRSADCLTFFALHPCGKAAGYLGEHNKLWRNRVRKFLCDVAKGFYYIFVAPAGGDSIRRLVQKPLVHKMLSFSLGKTLEAGCGIGLYSFYLQKKSSCLTALDVNEVQLKILKNAFRRRNFRSHFLLASLPFLCFKDHTFDTVVCTEVLEHVKEDLTSLQEMRRILKPEGKLLLSCPVPPSPFEENHSTAKEPHEHVREGYTREQLLAITKKAGFEVIKLEYCFLFFSRVAFQFIYFFQKFFKFRPPAFLTLFALLDCLIIFKKGAFMPFDCVGLFEKTARKRNQVNKPNIS